MSMMVAASAALKRGLSGTNAAPIDTTPKNNAATSTEVAPHQPTRVPGLRPSLVSPQATRAARSCSWA